MTSVCVAQHGNCLEIRNYCGLTYRCCHLSYQKLLALVHFGKCNYFSLCQVLRTRGLRFTIQSLYSVSPLIRNCCGVYSRNLEASRHGNSFNRAIIKINLQYPVTAHRSVTSGLVKINRSSMDIGWIIR